MDVLVIGCGNILRGDDAAGPVLVRRMWERGLPPGVTCADGGTGGMDVAFQMRGRAEVILVDACRSGSEPGALFEVPGEEVENLPPLEGINLHAFRWDHAIAFGRWLLKDEYPARVTACLVEGASFEPGDALSPAVDAAVDALADRLLATLWMRHGFERQAAAAGDRDGLLEAIDAYRRALALGITADTDAEAYGQIQNNLGLAHLATPTRGASDALRHAIAIQAFREAARACPRDTHPGPWAMATVNLANALQYMPSGHVAENLAQAVEAYEEVLAVRPLDRDPVGHARVLVNQANALAHLGIFPPAREKAVTAADLLAAHGETDEAATARALVTTIDDTVTDRGRSAVLEGAR
jgi:hydrogenase maturation protease